MTLQQQADAILDGWNSHQAKQDELLVRLAQDRDALLDVVKRTAAHFAFTDAPLGLKALAVIREVER